MNRYKIFIMQLGYAIVDAETHEDAKYMADHLEPDQLHWISNNEEHTKPYLVTMIEQLDSSKNKN